MGSINCSHGSHEVFSLAAMLSYAGDVDGKWICLEEMGQGGSVKHFLRPCKDKMLHNDHKRSHQNTVKR